MISTPTPIPPAHSAMARLWAVLAAMAALLAGCSPEHYQQQADREVYDIIEAKWPSGVVSQSDYRIGDATDTDQAERTEPTAEPCLPPRPWPGGRISLAQAVRWATLQNHDYQKETENLYTEALDLTGVRHDYASRWFATGSGDYSHDDGSDSAEIGGNVGFEQLLADGAAISISLATACAGFLAGDGVTTIGSVFELSITQPLLRGFGRDIVTEPLTQAERDTLYEIRSFQRYRQTFVVSIVSSYYYVLRAWDKVRNARANYQNLTLAYEQIAMLADAGRKPRYEVDQARQRMLQAENNYLSTEQDYEQTLDEFKITLGFPTDLDIRLDPNELHALADRPVAMPDFTLAEAIEAALAHRLDLLNQRDQLDDAERKVAVAADALRMGLDISAAISADSEEPRHFHDLQFHHGQYAFGVDLDLPLDRIDERNDYRKQLISRNQTRRDYAQAIDEVKLDIRQSYRTVHEQLESYDIQRLSLTLAEERLSNMTILLQAGRANTRDLLDAQADLLEAQNALTAALINYTVARLNFFSDTGLLTVRDDALWEEPPAPIRTDTTESTESPMTEQRRPETITAPIPSDTATHRSTVPEAPSS